MITKRAKTGLARHGRIYGRRTFIGAAIAAAMALCVTTTAFGKRQDSSAAAQAQQKLALVRASRAAQDVDVGSFYMHKGDYGAAISRLEEAVQIDPRDPKARLLLAESYDKQGDRSDALKTYQNYLTAFPNARDAKKIRKKIAELSRERD